MAARTESVRTKPPALRWVSPEGIVVLTSEARIATDRASRYLTQLCRHASQMSQHPHYQPRTHGGGDAPPKVEHTEYSDTHGIIKFAWGQCTLQATQDTLTLRAEATDEDGLGRIQEGIARRLETIGRRGQLTVTWQQPQALAAPPEATSTAPTHPAGAATRRRYVMTIGLIALGMVAVAAHLGLFGALVAVSPWTSWGSNIILALILMKVLFLGGHVLGARYLGRLAKRHGLGHLLSRGLHRRAPAAPPGEATSTAPTHPATAAPRRRLVMTIGLIAVGVLLVAAHLGLFGAILAASP
jgi:hypothetical protein